MPNPDLWLAPRAFAPSDVELWPTGPRGVATKSGAVVVSEAGAAVIVGRKATTGSTQITAGGTPLPTGAKTGTAAVGITAGGQVPPVGVKAAHSGVVISGGGAAFIQAVSIGGRRLVALVVFEGAPVAVLGRELATMLVALSEGLEAETGRQPGIEA